MRLQLGNQQSTKAFNHWPYFEFCLTISLDDGAGVDVAHQGMPNIPIKYRQEFYSQFGL